MRYKRSDELLFAGLPVNNNNLSYKYPVKIPPNAVEHSGEV